MIVTFSVFFYNQDILGGLVFLVVGFGFLYSGFYIRNTNSRIQANGFKTKAKIVDFEKERIKDADGDSYTYHFPIVSFTDRNGIETTQKLDSNEKQERINEMIDIIYLKKENEYEIIKDNPKRIGLMKRMIRESGWIVLSTIGLKTKNEELIKLIEKEIAGL